MFLMALPFATSGAGLAAAGLGDVALAAAGLGAAGAIREGQSRKMAADFNASVQRQMAEREEAIGKLSAEQFSRDASRNLATTRVARLASGVTMSGTPLLVDEAAVDEIAFNEALIKQGAEVKATRLRQQAELDQFGGRSARLSGMFRAGSSLLEGAYRAGRIYGDSPLASSRGDFA